MRAVLLAGALAAAFVMGGCTSGVTRAPEILTQKAGISGSKQLSAVSISLTDDAKRKATENLKFNPNELLSHVRRALEARSLLTADADKSLPALEVQVKDMRVRSNFSAIMFGFMAGADSVTADVIVRSPTGQQLDRFEVATSYALGGIGGGQDSARMGWLYEKFAEETIKELTR
jgi:hypothetical protein